MAKRKTVLHIEGLTPTEAPQEVVTASEKPQVAEADKPEGKEAAEAKEAPQEVPAPSAEPKVAPKPKATSKPKPASKPHVGVSVAAATDEEPAGVAQDKTSSRTKANLTEPAAGAEKAAGRTDVAAAMRSVLPKPVAWIERVAPGHVNAVLGGLAGLIVALMVFIVGFWKTLFVCALVVVGVAVGQCLDGDPKIVNKLRQLLADERGDEQG